MIRWQAGSTCTTLDACPASTVTSCSTLDPWLMLLMERSTIAATIAIIIVIITVIPNPSSTAES